MGRHHRPSHTLRTTTVTSTALVAGLGALLAAPASADVPDGCATGTHNPDIQVCQDHPVTDGDSVLHALVRLNPLLCVHARVPDDHRLLGTRDCAHPATVVVAPAPCTCPTPALPTAPAPTTVTNSYGNPLPVVTH